MVHTKSSERSKKRLDVAVLGKSVDDDAPPDEGIASSSAVVVRLALNDFLVAISEGIAAC